jgi:hypothetical protein
METYLFYQQEIQPKIKSRGLLLQEKNVRLDYKFHFFEDLRAVVEAGIDRFDSSGHTEVSNQSVLGFSQKF